MLRYFCRSTGLGHCLAQEISLDEVKS